MSGAAIYLSLIGILNLVLAFYIFQLMVSIATKREDDYLLKRTTTTFRFYMVLMFLFTFLESFSINMTTSIMSGFILFSALIGLVMNILFLVLLSKFSKLPDDGNDPTDSNEPADKSANS
ncbi:hypothetical protein [Mesobacillus maritimus]|uniref:hypothetical protein n=1 Tax=Mesobacillus maritimus TaxID=1643336 RepID=UPI00384A5101